MRGYVDTSCIVSIALNERGNEDVQRRLARCDSLVTAGLLEAELMSALRREGADVPPPPHLELVDWILPLRHLGPEIAHVLAAGYLRGADCWHLATALYVAGRDRSALTFLTLDDRQAAVASKLGFSV